LSESSLFVVAVSELSEPRESLEEVSDFVEFSVAPEEASEDDASDDDESVEEEESGEPDELDESDESVELDESSATPVSTSTEPECLLSPESVPQVGQTARPWSSRTFSPMAICCDRLAWSALGAYARPPYFSQFSWLNCSPP
jgi:hypothetical protein